MKYGHYNIQYDIVPSLKLVNKKTSMSTHGFPYIQRFLCFKGEIQIGRIINLVNEIQKFLINVQDISPLLCIGCVYHIGLLNQHSTIEDA